MDVIHCALPGRVSYCYIPQTQVLVTPSQSGWRRTLCLCSGVILPYI